jgi:prophage antirepressor-like protein
MSNYEEHYFSYLNYPLRVVYIEEKPWFNIKDVANILCYLDSSYVVDIMEVEETNDVFVGINYSTVLINIQGVYRLLFDEFTSGSEFRKWFNDNLPAICFHGIVNKPEKDIYKQKYIEEARYDSLDARINSIYDKLLPALKNIDDLKRKVTELYRRS